MEYVGSYAPIGGGGGGTDGATATGGLALSSGLAVSPTEWKRFSGVVGFFLLFLIVMFGMFVVYPETFTETDSEQYLFYLNVQVMMLVGFGYLMTFMRKHGLGAVGLTMLITALCMPWCILTGRFFASLAGNYGEGYPAMPDTGSGAWGPIQLSINAFLQGQFATAAVLISFGGVIGKLTPSQLMIMAIIEVPLYSLNKELFCIGGLGTLDMGGTIFIHLFGAYFGLAVAWMVGPPKKDDEDEAEPDRTSDVFSLIGTVFLWIYWPSFNGATAPLGQNQQLLTMANTVLALCSSCMVTFALSCVLSPDGRLSTVDVQNATLAGGVAIGAASNLKITPAAAMVVGLVAGGVSTCGFSKLQGKLLDRFGLHDSCGIHNLHGMPALIGSAVVTIAVCFKSTQGDLVYPKGDDQYWAQLGGAGITLIFAVCTGLVTGGIIKRIVPKKSMPTPFNDEPFWTTATAGGKLE